MRQAVNTQTASEVSAAESDKPPAAAAAAAAPVNRLWRRRLGPRPDTLIVITRDK